MSRTSHTSHTLIPQSSSWADEFLCTCRKKIVVWCCMRSYKRDLLHCCNFADTGPSLQWSPFQFQMYRSNNHFHRSHPQRSWEEPRRRWTELGSSFFVVFRACWLLTLKCLLILRTSLNRDILYLFLRRMEVAAAKWPVAGETGEVGQRWGQSGWCDLSGWWVKGGSKSKSKSKSGAVKGIGLKDWRAQDRLLVPAIN